MLLLVAAQWHCTKKVADNASRSFYMGVTTWPADFTEDEFDQAYRFINDHCDIVSHHFDEGIPYEEAFHNTGWPERLLTDINTRKAKIAAGKKVLLSSSALDLTRKAKAPYSGFSETVTGEIKNKWLAMQVNNDSVVTAYVNYILFLATALQPAYINFAVESNEAGWEPDAFSRYLEFVSKVHGRLKIALPGMPLMVSYMVTEQPASLQFARQLLPYTDYVALSAYPYISVSSAAGGNTDPDQFPADYFKRFIDLDPAKPFCFAETGYLAENLDIAAYNLHRQGNSNWQNDYLQQVCALTNEHQGKFIIWFCYKDYDAGNNTLRRLGLYQDIFGLWEDTGLKDENGMNRPAYTTWISWMQLEKRN